MQAKVRTVAFQGVDVLPVDVQVMIAPGQLAFTVMGLADKAVGESRERVRAALRALGLALPPQRISVNLSPADLAKEGSHYDLPIALGLLVAMGVLTKESVTGFVVLGEPCSDVLEPGPSVVIGQRGAGRHLGDVGGRVEVVGLRVRELQPLGEQPGDGGLAHPRDAHHDDERRVGYVVLDVETHAVVLLFCLVGATLHPKV